MNDGKLKISWVAASLCSVVAILLASSADAQQALTVEQNMKKQIAENVIPGKKLTAKGPNYEFCEVGTIVGASKENAVVNAYNPTGIDHCSPAQAAEIEKDKEKIKKELGVMDVVINPSRHWTWDEISINQLGEVRQFGPVKMAWMGVEPLETLEKATFKGHYHPGNIYRDNMFKYNRGTPVYLLDMPDGKVMVMQSWTNDVNKSATWENLKDLGSQFKQLPPGWTFRMAVLDKDLTIAAPAPGYLAWITQDEFLNTYQGCGFATACNYVP